MTEMDELAKELASLEGRVWDCLPESWRDEFRSDAEVLISKGYRRTPEDDSVQSDRLLTDEEMGIINHDTYFLHRDQGKSPSDCELRVNWAIAQAQDAKTARIVRQEEMKEALGYLRNLQETGNITNLDDALFALQFRYDTHQALLNEGE